MKTSFLSYVSGLTEDVDPKSQGWYIKQAKADKTSVFIAGPMAESAAITRLDQLGGSEKGYSKVFISSYDIQAKKKSQQTQQTAQ